MGATNDKIKLIRSKHINFIYEDTKVIIDIYYLQAMDAYESIDNDFIMI